MKLKYEIRKREPKRKKRKLDGKLGAVKELIGQGLNKGELAKELGVSYNTLQTFLTENKLTVTTSLRDGSRNLEIMRRHYEGYSLTDVAKEYGLTRERVRQIVESFGYTTLGHLSQPRETLTKDRQKRLTSIEKFWESVDVKSEVECWLWKGSRSGVNNIIYFMFRGKQLHYASKVAFLLDRKRLPKGRVVTSCKNNRCVNPAHLVDKKERSGNERISN